MTDINGLIKEREQAHGEFWKTAEIAQDLKQVILHHNNSGRLDPVQVEALDMISSKIARILSGNPHHVDHWLDIEGYARLGGNFARAKTDG